MVNQQTIEEAVNALGKVIDKADRQGAADVATEASLRGVDAVLATVNQMNREANFCETCKVRIQASSERVAQKLRLIMTELFKGCENIRGEILETFRADLGPEYPAQWVDNQTAPVDFEGRSLTVDVFNVPVNMQRKVFERLINAQELARSVLGGRVIFIFHTPEATAEHYADVVAKLKKERPK